MPQSNQPKPKLKMKTKTLLIGAAIFAAGLVTSPAQFFGQTFDSGLNFCTPQLKRADMRAEVVLASSLHSGDQVITWTDNIGYAYYLFNGPGDWYDGITYEPIAGPVLAMGKGFAYQNNSGGPEVNSYTGRLSGGSEVLKPGGPHFIGSFVPVTANAEVILASCLHSGDQLYVWTGSGFVNAIYVGPGEWYDYITLESIPEPVLVKGQGFFYVNNSGDDEIFSQ
jgi:hypothetical protein